MIEITKEVEAFEWRKFALPSVNFLPCDRNSVNGICGTRVGGDDGSVVIGMGEI